MVSKTAVKWLMVGLALAVHAGCRNGESTNPGASNKYPVAQNDEVIVADCVVTFFSDANLGTYFSTQRHEIRPASKGILIWASEPQGDFTWRLSADGYAASIPSRAHQTAPAAMMDRDVVQAIAACFAASAGYYDPGKTQALDKVKIDGRWYEPLQLPAGRQKSPSGVTLFRTADEGRIDFVRVSSDGGRTITARSYNRHWMKDVGRYVPSKIDILEETSDTKPATRILQVHYSSINTLKG